MTVNLMIIDNPNLNKALESRLGHIPRKNEYPKWDKLLDWFMQSAPPSTHVSLPCLFANIRSNEVGKIQQQEWLQIMVNTGYRVFTKPKAQETDDIDDQMVQQIWYHMDKERRRTSLSRLVVISHDAKNFFKPLTEVKHLLPDIQITVLGLTGDAGPLERSTDFDFMDLRDIPGLIDFELPNSIVNLDDLPEHGKWFVPVSHKR